MFRYPLTKIKNFLDIFGINIIYVYIVFNTKLVIISFYSNFYFAHILIHA